MEYMKCDNRCGREAIYQENHYTALCITCWYFVAKGLFDDWSEDKKKPEPWLFNRDKII